MKTTTVLSSAPSSTTLGLSLTLTVRAFNPWSILVSNSTNTRIGKSSTISLQSCPHGSNVRWWLVDLELDNLHIGSLKLHLLFPFRWWRIRTRMEKRNFSVVDVVRVLELEMWRTGISSSRFRTNMPQTLQHGRLHRTRMFCRLYPPIIPSFIWIWMMPSSLRKRCQSRKRAVAYSHCIFWWSNVDVVDWRLDASFL